MTQGRHALVIGIDEYPYFPAKNQLKTCVADADLMADLLEGHFRFPHGAILRLRNGEATREGILGAMEELLLRTGEDDVVVIHYSGHGSQKRTRRDWSADGLSETIVPYDSGRKGFPRPHENRDVVDDEIHDWLLRLHAKTPNVTLVFDSCHAGTITRRPSVGIRRIPSDEELAGEPRGPRPRGTRRGGRFGDHHVLIAACREDQNAHEYPEVGFGALTYFVHQELLRARPGETYRDFFERVAPRVKNAYRDQHPQLEGVWDRQIFGLRDFEPMRYVAVQRRDGEHVVLGAGKAHGVSSGSEWMIYPVGTRETDAPTCGKVRLTAVGAVKSRGEILDEDAAHPVDAGARAVELAHVYDEVRWKVEVRGEPPPELGALLRRALDASPLLARAEPGETGDARIHFLTPDGGCEGVPQLDGEVREDTWAAVGKSGGLLMKPRRGDPRHVGPLIAGLERWCRFDYVHRLDNANPESVLRGRVAVDLLKRDGARWRPAEPTEQDRIVYEEEEELALAVRNLHGEPIYVSVLDLGLTGAVSQIYPVAGSLESLAADRTLKIGTREGDQLVVYLPRGFPFAPPDPAAGEECVKVFATVRPADFRWLTQRGVVRGHRHPLERLLRRTLGGPQRGGTRHVATDDWTAVTCRFSVRRKGP